MDSESLIFNGVRVDPRLLEIGPVRRCRLDECQAHCCGGGVSISIRQADDVLAHAELIQPHLPEDRRDPAGWFDRSEVEADDDYPRGEPCIGTQVVPDPTHPMGTTCVFLRPGDRWCALQVAGSASGQHPWRFKPFYCALHPLTFDKGMVTLDDENEIYIEGGSCNRPELTADLPWFKLYAAELRLALGEGGYEALLKQI